MINFTLNNYYHTMTENTKKNGTESKSVRHIIEEKMAVALAEYKEQIGEKKFSEKIEKAAKIFLKSIKKSPAIKRATGAKPAAKKATKAPAKAVKKTVKKAEKKQAAPAKKVAVKK
jgi:hypothetical protein